MVTELRGGDAAEQRHIKTAVIGLRIERALHQRVGHDADNCSPRTAAEPGSKIRTRRPIALSLTEIFVREAGVHDRHRLFLVVVFNCEVATFQNLQAERGEVTVGDGFEIALRAVPLGHIILAINFILAEATEGHVGNGHSSPRSRSRDWSEESAKRA